MKYTIIGILIAAGLVLLLSFTRKQRAKKKEQAVLDYIKENPEKSSIKLVRNGNVVVSLNEDMMMPLASTLKIMIAIEYAEQAASGLIDPSEVIGFDQLDYYYAPGTDGGAHMAWFKSLKDKIKGEGVELREVAKGMINFSSNANTEWLMRKLGQENINNRLRIMGIENHSPIYPIVSALFIGKELFPNLEGQELADSIAGISDSQYLETIDQIHQKMSTDENYKNSLGGLNLAVQKVWSDRLPASTTGAYVSILRHLNSRKYFDMEVHKHLTEVLEGVMENPRNQEWLQHSGMKGGSTAFVLTKAVYATDRKGNTTELAYFFNDIGFLENSKLQRAMNQFEMRILTESEFLEEIQKELASLQKF